MPAADEPLGSLPPELNAFLMQLSVALHKHRAYPAGHPMRVESCVMIHGLLAGTLASRPTLRIGVARHYLLIDDKASDASQPVLRELAERLHRRQIGAVVLTKGVTPDELEAALERMNVDPRRNPGNEGAGVLRIGEHIEILPMSYTNLVLVDGAAPASAEESVDDLWADLARFTADPSLGFGEAGVQTLAQALVSLEPQKRSELLAVLEQFGRAAVRDSSEKGVAARTQLREVMGAISRDEMARLVGVDLTRPESIDRLLAVSEWLAIPAVIDLVESASHSSGQSVSHSLLRLIRKLGSRAPLTPEEDAQGDHGVREAVQALLRGWNLNDPNPLVHTRLLDELSQRDPSNEDGSGEHRAESERVVRMAIELGVGGPIVMEAVDGMIESGQLLLLMELLDVPQSNEAAVEIWAHLIAPETLRRVLLEEPIDQAACVQLLTRVPIESAEGLLDSLTISESQTTRWLILRRLAEMGRGVADLLIQRLDRAPWYLRRNLLGLLADLPEVPDGFSARRYADESEPLLRLEALRLMLRAPADREDAMHRTLGDPDDRLVRAGLEAGMEFGLPRASLPRLMKLLNDQARPVELRARGIALLGQFATPTVRQWLVERSLTRRGLFRRLRLAPKTPDLVAGLTVLARLFASHPQAAGILKLAKSSGDAELVSAAAGEKAS